MIEETWSINLALLQPASYPLASVGMMLVPHPGHLYQAGACISSPRGWECWPATARELPSAAGRGLDGRCLGSYASTIPRVAWSQPLTDLRAQRLSPCALRWGPCSRGAAPALALPVRPGSGQVSAETTSLLGFSFICIPYFPLGSPEGIRSITHAGKNPCQAVLSGTSPKAQERRVWVSRN